MEESMKENILRTKNKEMEPFIGQMADATLVNGLMESNMVKELLWLLMDNKGKVNGIMEKEQDGLMMELKIEN